jgi:FecR protein
MTTTQRARHWSRLGRRSCALSLASLGLALAVAAQEPHTAIGLIKTTTGEVSLVRQERTQAATPGTLLYQGDTLHTGEKHSSVAVTLIDETRFALGPRSRLVLHHFAWNPTTQAGGMQAHLDRGTMAVQSGLLGQRQAGTTGLAVTTPRATVRVTDAQVAIRVTGKE